MNKRKVVHVIPASAPERLRRAHDCIRPIFDFLAQYNSWIAHAKPTACDFALGNPQTMPLPPFVTAVYARETLEKLAAILEDASRRMGRIIYLVSDEAYRAIVYDARRYVSPTTPYRNSIMIYSYGKTLLTPGQRLGYLALSPHIEERHALRDLMASSQILCGWAMSSALMQHALGRLERLSLNVDELQARRDRFVAGLREIGYAVHVPEGAFYVTPKTPIDDDARFAAELAREGVFCLPGHVVHMPGHLRAPVTATAEMIEQRLPKFSDVYRRLDG